MTREEFIAQVEAAILTGSTRNVSAAKIRAQLEDLANNVAWSDEVGSGAVTSVAGRTGVVTLTKTDVGLSNVNNTADASKPVSTLQAAADAAIGTAAAADATTKANAAESAATTAAAADATTKANAAQTAATAAAATDATTKANAAKARATHTGTQLASTISDFDAQVQANRLDQLAAPNTSVSAGNQKITNLADPVSTSDAVTKGYADALLQGLSPKQSVRAATTANITLSGAQTIDGVAVIAGDRVLVKNQSTGSQNGIYLAASGAWSRAVDADTAAEIKQAFAFAEEGTTNADTGWVMTTNAPITLGSTALTFVQFGTTATIADASVVNAKLADMAASTLKGRAAGAGTGVPTDLSVAQVKTMLDLTGTNSGDQTSVTGNAGTATTLATPRAIQGVNFDGSAPIEILSTATQAATVKTTPVDADTFSIFDSAASFVLKKLTWANIKAALLTLVTYTDPSFLFSVEPGTDDTATGPKTGSVNAGATITQWDVCYLGSGGKWLKASAGDIATAEGILVLSLESKTDTQAMLVALPGAICRNDGWTWSAPGVPLYLSATAGAITETQPASTDQVIRPIGWALSDDCIYFNPSPDTMTHT